MRTLIPLMLLPAVLLGFVSLGGCGDSTEPDDENAVTAEEAALFLGDIEGLALGSVTGQQTVGVGLSTGMAAAVQDPPPIDVVLPCPVTGSLELEGSYTFESGEGGFTITSELTQTFSNCTAEVHSSMETEPVMVTADGSTLSSYTVSGMMPEGFSVTQTLTGELTLSKDQGPGRTCVLNLSVVVNATTMSMEGTVCGHAITHSFTFQGTGS